MMGPGNNFAPLHLHTNFSALDGIQPVTVKVDSDEDGRGWDKLHEMFPDAIVKTLDDLMADMPARPAAPEPPAAPLTLEQEAAARGVRPAELLLDDE